MRKKITILILFSVLLLFIIQPMLYGGYCLIYPNIGTEFLTKEFSKEKFNNIKHGSSKLSVEKNIGITNDIRKKYYGFDNSEMPSSEVKYFAYYTKQKDGFFNSYAFEVFVVFYNKDFIVIGKQNGWWYE